MVMDNRIGAQYYTIRNFCKTLEEFDESCKKVSEIGYKVVQLSGIGDFTGAEVKAVLDKYGLTCACTHRAPDKYLEHLDEEIEFHKTIGCKVCGIGVMPGGIKETLSADECMELVDNFAKDFGPVCEKLAEHGLVFAYHNHGIEFIKINGKYLFDELLERMQHNNFKLILDVYWLSSVGVNPAKFITEHKDQIACLHFKDLKVLGHKNETYAEVGQGNLDWDEIIEAAHASSAEFALVEQDESDKDPFESLKISYEFLQKKGFH